MSAAAKILRWQPYRNTAGTMLGFLSVELASGLVINDAKLMIGPAGTYWVALPAIKQVGKDGEPKLDANGKQIWSPVVEIPDRNARERFGALIVDALRRQHPDALGELPLKDGVSPRPGRLAPPSRRYSVSQAPRRRAEMPTDTVDDLWQDAAP
jgi:DNA-binding cell septation regulator SpoVG